MPVALAPNALTSAVAELEADLGATNATDKIRRLINAASDSIEQYCRRTFYRSTAVVEKVAARGDGLLLLSRLPVNSITSITYDGSTVSANDYELEDSEAGLVRHTGGRWTWAPLSQSDPVLSPLPGTERRRYQITYDGGYYTPQQEEEGGGLITRTLPYDLEEACIELVRARYLAKSRDPSVSSEKLMNWNASYGGASKGSDGSELPAPIRQMLKPYRRLDW